MCEAYPGVWLTVNNPIWNDHYDAKAMDDTAWRMEVLKRLPNLGMLDGVDVTDDELEAAANA